MSVQLLIHLKQPIKFAVNSTKKSVFLNRNHSCILNSLLVNSSKCQTNYLNHRQSNLFEN